MGSGCREYYGNGLFSLLYSQSHFQQTISNIIIDIIDTNNIQETCSCYFEVDDHADSDFLTPLYIPNKMYISKHSLHTNCACYNFSTIAHLPMSCIITKNIFLLYSTVVLIQQLLKHMCSLQYLIVISVLLLSFLSVFTYS